jgi:3-oxoacyl-[acyl-carrier-protein] synthase-3
MEVGRQRVAMIGINHISFYLPETVLGNDALEAKFTFNPGFLERKVGITERRMAHEKESTSDLCIRAAEGLFAKTDLPRNEIDLLLLCTQNGDYKLPHTSAVLQHRLGLPTSVAAFDMSLGCSGYVYSLAVIQAWMQTQRCRNSLLFTCDPYSKIINPEDRGTVPIFGDAATVTWISSASRNRLHECVFGTDGEHYQALIVRNSGTCRDPGILSGSSYLEMDGRILYEYMLRVIPQAVQECLVRNALEMSDIDYFIFHPGSRHLLEGIRKGLGIPVEKMICNLKLLGNTVSSTVPLALADVMQREPLAGKRVLLCGFGVGLSWAAGVFTFEHC